MVVCVFFFTQKTAYEMRISDWSSDVCSSDLVVDSLGLLDLAERPRADLLRRGQGDTNLVEGRSGLDRIEDVQDFLVHLDSFCGTVPAIIFNGTRCLLPLIPATTGMSG